MDEPQAEVSHEEFIEGLRKHERWLNGDPDELDAARADWSKRRINLTLDQVCLESAFLAEADLSGSKFAFINLSKADLRQAILDDVQIGSVDSQSQKHSNFCGAVLSGASLRCGFFRGTQFRDGDLRGADLSGADLRDCDFSGTQLRGCNLRDAKLDGVTGLDAHQLFATDLTGATLPEAIRDFKGLEMAAEAAKTSHKLWLTVLAACFYCALTVVSTTDASLFGNTAALTLPLLQASVPIGLFMAMAPALLLCGFLYLHFSLMDVWTAWASLPAVFPDGRRIHERMFPSIINSLAQMHFERLRTTVPWQVRLQGTLTKLALWCTAPALVILFWARCLILRNVLLTCIQLILLCTTLLAARLSWMTMETILRTQSPDLDSGLRPGLTHIERAAARTASAVVWLTVFCLSFGSISWATFRSDAFNNYCREHGLAFLTSVYLEDQAVSTIEKPQSYMVVNWKHARARGIHAAGARIIGCNLSEGDFERGDFRKSVLASYRPGWENRVNLFYTNLFEADFREAALVGVDFFSACYDGLNLQGAYIDAQSLNALCLGCTRNWILATLDEQGLRQWQLRPKSGPFSEEQIARLRIKNFVRCDFTQFPEGGMPNLALGDLRGLEFEGAIFQDGLPLNSANLTGANFRRAQLKGADLTGALVENADFRGANLCSVKGLTVRMGRQVLFDKESRIPAEIALALGLPVNSCDSQTSHPPQPVSSCAFIRAASTPVPR